MRLIPFLLAAYLAGSVNFAVIVLRLLGLGDPRDRFSGNAGTTNVFRQAGKGWASLVLLLDVGRAIGLATAALAWLPPAQVPWVGLALVAGNRFPLFHGFRGGKGVASYLGFVLPLAPGGAAAACLLWVLIQRLAGQPFIASFFMVFTLAGAAIAAADGNGSGLAGTLLTLLVILGSHWQNLVAYRQARRPQAKPAQETGPGPAAGPGGA